MHAFKCASMALQKCSVIFFQSCFRWMFFRSLYIIYKLFYSDQSRASLRGEPPFRQPIRHEESDPCPPVHRDACHVTGLREKCQHGSVARTMFFPTIISKGTSGLILCRTSAIRTIRFVFTRGNETRIAILNRID